MFIIRAIDRVGMIGWIMPPNERNIRTIGTRSDADVFTSREAAEAVIVQLAPTFAGVPLDYAVEPCGLPLPKSTGRYSNNV
jgi:hypothetical protein